MAFDDLLAANATYAADLDTSALEPRARAGVAVVTCMDSRIDPLAMLGLGLGDAKVIRTPGGRLTEDALQGLILATNLLTCDRVMIIEHTGCAVANNTEEQFREKVSDATGVDASSQTFPSIADQDQRLREDVETVRAEPLIPSSVEVGAFVYDVATGRLEQRT
jgi:carbonic anhydrase